MAFPDRIFRVDGQLVVWRDEQAVVHACMGEKGVGGHTLIWTLCEKDVPANAGYTSDDADVTCADCKERIPWYERARSSG